MAKPTPLRSRLGSMLILQSRDREGAVVFNFLAPAYVEGAGWFRRCLGTYPFRNSKPLVGLGPEPALNNCAYLD
jgi:hypothetical protein